MLCTWFLCAAADATYSRSLLRDATKEIGDVCMQANIWRQHTTLLPGGPDEDQKWLNLVRPFPMIDPHFRWRTKSKAGSKRRIFTNDSCHGIRLWSPPDSFVIYVFVYLTCTTYLSFRSLTNWKHDKNVPSIYTVTGNSWTKNWDCAPFKLLTLLGEYIKCSTDVCRS